jgi:hypothetical protein
MLSKLITRQHTLILGTSSNKIHCSTKTTVTARHGTSLKDQLPHRTHTRTNIDTHITVHYNHISTNSNKSSLSRPALQSGKKQLTNGFWQQFSRHAPLTSAPERSATAQQNLVYSNGTLHVYGPAT